MILDPQAIKLDRRIYGTICRGRRRLSYVFRRVMWPICPGRPFHARHQCCTVGLGDSVFAPEITPLRALSRCSIRAVPQRLWSSVPRFNSISGSVPIACTRP